MGWWFDTMMMMMMMISHLYLMKGWATAKYLQVFPLIRFSFSISLKVSFSTLILSRRHFKKKFKMSHNHKGCHSMSNNAMQQYPFFYQLLPWTLFLAEFFLLSLCVDLNSYIEYIPSSSQVPYWYPILLQSIILEILEGPQMSFQMGFHFSLNHNWYHSMSQIVIHCC